VNGFESHIFKNSGSSFHVTTTYTIEAVLYVQWLAKLLLFVNNATEMDSAGVR